MITSTKNPRVKEIARLRRRGERTERRRFLVEGSRELERALDAGVELEQVVFCAELLSRAASDVVASARARGVDLLEASATVFASLSHREGPDGVLGVAHAFDTSLERLSLGDDPLVLVAGAIEKPGNLGAMIRSAGAAGVSAVVVADSVTDVFNPNVVRASQGALFTVPVAVAGRDEVVAWLRDRGIRMLATTPDAAVPYWSVPLEGPTAIVIGAESTGLPDTWLDAADDRVVIPMAGGPGVDSLNAASAAAVLLFDAVRRRSAGGRR